MAETANGDDRERTDDRVEFDHVIVEYEKGPAACTLYPRRCSERDLAGHRITATEGAFVDLAEMR